MRKRAVGAWLALTHGPESPPRLLAILAEVTVLMKPLRTSRSPTRIRRSATMKFWQRQFATENWRCISRTRSSWHRGILHQLNYEHRSTTQSNIVSRDRSDRACAAHARWCRNARAQTLG